MPAATVSASTRTAFPNLSFQAESTASLRTNATFYARRLAHYPTTLAAFVDYAFGTASRATDKRKARAVCLRELAALESNPVAAAELTAVYLGVAE